MFHRLWTLIRKELQSLLREPQTRAILILPVLIPVSYTHLTLPTTLHECRSRWSPYH